MKIRANLAAIVVLAVFAPGPNALAASGTQSGQPAQQRVSPLPWADGIVEDIDRDNDYVILKHGPIRNLQMDDMTMAFALRDPAMLRRLKVGDRVRFTAIHVDDVATITAIRVRKPHRQPIPTGRPATK